MSSKQDLINKILDKVNFVITYLKQNGGYEYKVYDEIQIEVNEPNSNIVKIAEDIKEMLEILTDTIA